MQTLQNGKRQRAAGVWTGLILIVVVALTGTMWKAARSSQAMSTAGVSDQVQFARLPEGSPIKLVLEILSVRENGTLQGIILEKKTEQIYKRTSTKVTARLNDHTAYVMGKREDLKNRAIVHVTGKLGANHGVDAEQIVILTGYVNAE